MLFPERRGGVPARLNCHCHHSGAYQLVAEHIALLEDRTDMIACIVGAVLLLDSVVYVGVEFRAESFYLCHVHLRQEGGELVVYHAHAVFEVLIGTLCLKRSLKAVQYGEELLHALYGSVLIGLCLFLGSPLAVVVILCKEPQVLVVSLCQCVLKV